MAQSTANKWTELAAQMGVDVAVHSDSVSGLLSSAAVDEDLAFNPEV
jgi:hypothetical protein